jgi:hypothetical protein
LKKRLDPTSPEAIDAACESIRRMTPEEAYAFLTYRTPGIEETDMTGMLSSTKKRSAPAKRRIAARKAAALK